MRLRRTQFVFLLLLLCSVQPGEGYVRQLTAVAPASVARTLPSAARTQLALTRQYPVALTGSSTTLVVTHPIAVASELAVMSPPASSAAAIAHHTSLLRA